MTLPTSLVIERAGSLDLEHTYAVLWSPITGRLWREPFTETFLAGRRSFLEGRRDAAWILMGIYRTATEADLELSILLLANQALGGDTQTPFDNLREEP